VTDPEITSTLGKAMGANLPEQVIVVGIAMNHIDEFGKELSLPVAQAIPKATQIVIDLL
jgi:Ni,Fe-hydrogenase maturation factor